MGKNSGISWTHHTFNPWIGCTKVSEGCKFCYAEEWDKRFSNAQNTNGAAIAAHWGPGAPRRMMSTHYWNDPLRWDREAGKTGEKARVFCASLADVFDTEAPSGQRERLWPLVKKTNNLIWLVLTKRPENIPSMLPDDWNDGYPNVWLGTTTEDQKNAENRIEHIKKVKAKVKFLSVEPQIEEIDFSKWMDVESEEKPPFNWLIFGGESGTNARYFNPDWVKRPLMQADQLGVAVFVKQMGTIWAKENNTADKKAGNPEEWPDWIQRQDFPQAA